MPRCKSPQKSPPAGLTRSGDAEPHGRRRARGWQFPPVPGVASCVLHCEVVAHWFILLRAKTPRGRRALASRWVSGCIRKGTEPDAATLRSQITDGNRRHSRSCGICLQGCTSRRIKTYPTSVRRRFHGPHAQTALCPNLREPPVTSPPRFRVEHFWMGYVERREGEFCVGRLIWFVASARRIHAQPNSGPRDETSG